MVVRHLRGLQVAKSLLLGGADSVKGGRGSANGRGSTHYSEASEAALDLRAQNSPSQDEASTSTEVPPSVDSERMRDVLGAVSRDTSVPWLWTA